MLISSSLCSEDCAASASRRHSPACSCKLSICCIAPLTRYTMPISEGSARTAATLWLVETRQPRTPGSLSGVDCLLYSSVKIFLESSSLSGLLLKRDFKAPRGCSIPSLHCSPGTGPCLSRCCWMAEQTYCVTATARLLIAQCRSDIEAGWRHLEAARAMLRQSRWLLARWEEQRRAGFDVVKLPDIVAARAEMFVSIEPAARRRRRRTARSTASRRIKVMTKAVTQSERSGRA